MLDLQVWDCKIVISNEKGLPVGFDTPPRIAAQEAIEDAGFEVFDPKQTIVDGDALALIEKKVARKHHILPISMDIIEICYFRGKRTMPRPGRGGIIDIS